MIRIVWAAVVVCLNAWVSAGYGQSSDPVTLLEQGRHEYQAGHFARAEAFLRAALENIRPQDEAARATTLISLGDIYVNKEEFSAAERAYTQAFAIYKRNPDKKRTVLILRRLGAVYSIEGRHDDALGILKKAIKLAEAPPVVSPPLMAEVFNTLAVVYYRQKKINKAEPLFEKARQILSGAKGQDVELAKILSNLGTIYYTQHKYPQAEDMFRQSLAITETAAGAFHPDLTFALVSLGVLYTQTGRYTEAEEAYRRCITTLEQNTTDFDVRLARALHALSDTYLLSGKPAEAETALARATSIAKRNLKSHPDLSEVLEAYSRLLHAFGKVEDSKQMRSEAQQARVRTGLLIHAHNPN